MSSYDSDVEVFDDLHIGIEALRKASTSRSIPLTEKAKETLQRLEDKVPAAKEQLREWKLRIKDQAVRAAKKTDEVIHEYPWHFTLGALGLGVLAGLAITYLSDNSESEIDRSPRKEPQVSSQSTSQSRNPE